VVVKRPEREDVNSPSCSVEVKLTWSCLHSTMHLSGLVIN
jgi:hypothetical protein